MKQQRRILTLALLLAVAGWAGVAQGQNPTAIQRLQLSAFGGVSGVFTGLSGGKNFSVTAGADLALPPYRRIRPTLEVRGTYPTDRGLVDNQQSILGGLRVDYPLGHRWHPYGDFLFGRGEIDYTPYGYLFQNFVYDLTTTFVYSPGAGFDYDVSQHLAIKVDGQFQRWGSAPTPSGAIYSKVGTAGIVYRFDFNRHGNP
jgi:hypothetical protein